MNILHINQSDKLGGAGLAAWRLHRALVRAGHDSAILAGQVATDSPNAVALDRTAGNGIWERNLRRVTTRIGLNFVHILSTWNIRSHPCLLRAHIVHCHNLHSADGGYFNYLALPRLARVKPHVITLHDQWLLTGHCAYSGNCSRWQRNCGNCPDLTLYPACHRDATRLEIRLKSWAIHNAGMSLICPSRWMQRCVQQSRLRNHPCYHVPYCIDVGRFRPDSTADVTQRKAQAGGKLVVLVPADCLLLPRKGAKHTAAALQALPERLRRKTELLLFGRPCVVPAGFTGRHMGWLQTEDERVAAYASADVLFFPSIEDNLPLVLMEALACALPQVVFNTGGIADLVVDGKTGILVKTGDTDALTSGLVRILEDLELRLQMAMASRKHACETFAESVVLPAMMAVYEQTLSNWRKGL